MKIFSAPEDWFNFQLWTLRSIGSKWRIFPPVAVWEIAHAVGHRKSHFKRTQYWKHSSEKRLRNAAEPSESNKRVALNCQTYEALISKPLRPNKGGWNGPTCYWAHALKLKCLCFCLVHRGGVQQTRCCREWSYTCLVLCSTCMHLFFTALFILLMCIAAHNMQGNQQ